MHAFVDAGGRLRLRVDALHGGIELGDPFGRAVGGLQRHGLCEVQAHAQVCDAGCTQGCEAIAGHRQRPFSFAELAIRFGGDRVQRRAVFRCRTGGRGFCEQGFRPVDRQ